MKPTSDSRRRRVEAGSEFVEHVGRIQTLRQLDVAAQRFERRRQAEIDYAAAVEAMAAFNRCEPGAVRPRKADVADALRLTRRSWSQFYGEVFAALRSQSTASVR